MCGTITLDEELIDVVISALKSQKNSFMCRKALVKVQEVKDALVAQREMS